MAWKLGKKIPDGLWLKCDGCGRMVFRKIVAERFEVCPECHHHFPMIAPDRIKLLIDDGSFAEMYAGMTSADPLAFVDRIPYAERLAGEREKTGLNEAVVVGEGKMDGRDVVIGIMDSRFIMASMGSVVGEKIARAFETATRKSVPMIMVCASGGA